MTGSRGDPGDGFFHVGPYDAIVLDDGATTRPAGGITDQSHHRADVAPPAVELHRGHAADPRPHATA